MEEDIGIACGKCDTFSPMGAERCPSCGHDLALFSEPKPAETPPAAEMAARPDAAPAPPSEEEMEQTRYYVCKECSTPVPTGHKFCGACGATVPKDVLERKVEFFGSMQAPGKARLILIRGTEGADGLSYLLQGTEHIAGTTDAQIPFPNDPWISAKHANFFYRDEKLLVRDEGSTNGVYIRIKQPSPLNPGDHFLCGEQVFRLDATPKDTSGPDPDQTYFYSSPKRPSPFRVVQVLTGGADGMVYCARENAVQIGREDSDMNFPDDVFMSGSHAKVELSSDGQFSLVDLGSRNGTYVRLASERELTHGDYVFIGHQLLRVEQTA
ncbi:MAG TPA: FHA domain-containing protein [Sandaracinaceae bacterium LLY-WYZ-13_1]|nr:FHA domain-containing protein [Sandaracinaceae bacterium LLY-WYZ-13_1]